METVEERRAGAPDAKGKLEAQQERPEREKPAAPSFAERQSDTAGAGEGGAPRKGFIRRRPLLTLLAAAAVVAVAAAGYDWWTISSQYVTTEDAYIEARFYNASAKVSGYIEDVPVTDNQSVNAGETLAIIDPRDYQALLAQAEATLEQARAAIPNIDAEIAGQQAQIGQAQAQISDAEAALRFAVEENDRAQALVKTGAGTVQTAQQTHSQLLQAQATADRAKEALIAAQKQLAAYKAQRLSAEATIDQAKAERDQAQLNLSYTVVKAEQAGTVAQLTASKGEFAQAGQSLMTIVPTEKWVVANFRETAIYELRPGQSVDIHVDAYPNRTFKGHVDSIQSGSGTAFSLLPAENATGNFVKVVQRVPVKIVFDKMPDVVLGPGMSVEPSVHLR
ncbi:MAG: HlyD family secretion protein [Rhodomicrobium sp.]